VKRVRNFSQILHSGTSYIGALTTAMVDEMLD